MDAPKRERSVFHGWYIWVSIAMAVGGYALVESDVSGGGGLMFFGGLNLGFGLSHNIQRREAARAEAEGR